MRRLMIVVALIAASVVAASPAAANVPNGVAHSLVPGLRCEDGGTYLVQITPGNGGTGWRVDAEQQHHVVGTFTTTVYLGGVLVSSETREWGKRAGLEPLECTGYFSDGTGLEVFIEATIYPLPPSS